MKGNEKSEKSQKGKSKESAERFKLEKKKGMTHVVNFTDGSQDKAMSTSYAGTSESLRQTWTNCERLFPKCKEARVILEDLRYTNVLTKQHRQKLALKRRRSLSSASERTKESTQEVVKEDKQWTYDLTSSSLESRPNCPVIGGSNIFKPLKKKHKSEEKKSRAKDPRNVETELEKKKGRGRPKGKNNKTHSDIENPSTGTAIDNCVSNLCCLEIKKESNDKTEPYGKSLKRIRDSKKEEKRVRKLKKTDQSKDGSKILSGDEHRCSRKKSKKKSSERKIRSKDKRRDSFKPVQNDPKDSSIFSVNGTSKDSANKSNETVVVNQLNVKSDDTSSIPVSSKNPLSQPIDSNFLENPNASLDARDNELSSYLNGDSRCKDFNSLQPFPEIPDKQPCSLASLEQAIEHDLAAGNRLLPLDNCDGITEGIIDLPIDIDSLPGELVSGDQRISGSQETLQRESQHHDFGGSAISELRDTNGNSLETAQGLDDKKRRQPEFTEENLLSRNTLDILSIRTKKTGRPEAAIDCEELTMFDKLTNEANNSIDNRCEEKLSGAFKNWSAQPEIAAFLDCKTLSNNNNFSVDICEDSLNNNNKNQLSNEKENQDRSIYSLLPVTSSPRSNVSDECRAMSNLLSAMDVHNTIENPIEQFVPRTEEKEQVMDGIRSFLVNEDGKSSKSEQSTTKDSNESKSIGKLTKRNLDKLNTMYSDDAMSDTVISLHYAMTKSHSSKIEQREAPINRASGSQSSQTRKRKWLPDDCNAKSLPKRNDEKTALKRKLLWNGKNWIPEKLSSSSTTSLTTPSVPQESKRQRKENELKNCQDSNAIGEAVSLHNNDKINETGCEKMVDNTMDDNCKKSNKEGFVPIEASDEQPEVPVFGVSSIYTDCKESSQSSTSSGSSSSWSSSDSSKKKSVTDGDRVCLDNNRNSWPSSIADTSKDSGGLKNQQCTQDLIVPAVGEEMKAPLSTAGTKTPVILGKKKNASFSKKVRLPSKILVDKTKPETKTRHKVTEIKRKHDVRKMEASFNRNELEIPSLEADNSGELHDNDPVARMESTPINPNNNSRNTYDDDEEDCISLFTESLCMSRCDSPPLNDSGKNTCSRMKQEPYARMKSANIEKFVTENCREFDMSFEAYMDDVRESQTKFEQRLTVDPGMAVSSNSDENKAHGGRQVENKLDLRSTLHPPIYYQDIPSLFRGQCYAWLRSGICRMENFCRFRHGFSKKLQNIQQFEAKFIEEILTHAINNRFGNFISYVWDTATRDMSTAQIKSLYVQLFRARILTISHVEKIAEALQQRGLSPTDILSFLLTMASQNNPENLRHILLVMHEKLEPGTIWDTLKNFSSNLRLPPQVIETIMEETIKKNCKVRAEEVYESVIKKIPYQTVTEIRNDLRKKFHELRTGSSNAITGSTQLQSEELENRTGSRTIISPESPRSDENLLVEQSTVLSKQLTPETGFNYPAVLTQAIANEIRSPSSIMGSSYNLHLIDNLPAPKSPYRDKLWKFHWDLQGMQEGLKHNDYAHVISILSQYAKCPNRLPHIEGFYKILCKEITATKHHLIEIVRLTVQSGLDDALCLYVYDLGVYVLRKLVDNGLWQYAYELLETLTIFRANDTCAFVLLAAEIYIANRCPLKALRLFKKTRIIYTDPRMWKKNQCQDDEIFRVLVLDVLLYALSDDHPVDAFKLLKFILKDQQSLFTPINLGPQLERMGRVFLSRKRTNLVIDMARLLLQESLIVSSLVFRGIVNHIFHKDLILARQLHRYATYLGVYSRVKMNRAYTHLIINSDWTEEETFLVMSAMIKALYVNIANVIYRLETEKLNVFLVFETIPSERQLAGDVSDNETTLSAIKRCRIALKNILDHFRPKIKIFKQIQERIYQLENQSLCDYMKSRQKHR